jgi:hypothetical protein
MRRIGLLYRGTRGAARASERAEALLGPLFQALEELGGAPEHVVYADDAVDDVRRELLQLDGVLVWVNPIQDRANRACSTTCYVMSPPIACGCPAPTDVIAKMGTIEVLYRTRALGWGSEVGCIALLKTLASAFRRSSCAVANWW